MCSRTMDDSRDPDKRSFHAQYGKLAVSVRDVCRSFLIWLGGMGWGRGVGVAAVAGSVPAGRQFSVECRRCVGGYRTGVECVAA